MLRKLSFIMLLLALALIIVRDRHRMTTAAQPEATPISAELAGRVITDSPMSHSPLTAQPRGNEPDLKRMTFVIMGRDRTVSPELMNRLAELKMMGQISTFDAQYGLGRVLVQGASDIMPVLRGLPDVAAVTRPDTLWVQTTRNAVPAPTPAGKSPSSSGTIIGTVAGADSGLPLNDIFIWVYNSSCGEEFQDTTASSGSFHLSGLPAGSYDMYLSDGTGVYASGWYDNKTFSARDSISVTDGMTTVVNIKWGLAGVIQGTITDEASGAPLPYAGVQLYDKGEHPTGCSCTYLPLIIAPYLPAVLAEPLPMALEPPVQSQSVCSEYWVVFKLNT
jgi:hypothetical protein